MEEGARSVQLRASELVMVLDKIDMTKLKWGPRYSRVAKTGKTSKGNREAQEKAML